MNEWLTLQFFGSAGYYLDEATEDPGVDGV